MDFLSCIPFKFLLPFVLLGLQLSLKFFIDRRATALNFATSILEVPINILFVSLSLLSAVIIAGSGNLQLAYMISLGVLCMLPFWRRSVEHLEKKYFVWSFSLGVLNLSLALPTIIGIIYFLMNNAKIN